MNKYLARLSKKARELTLSPGVYIMKDKKGEIIYIGKAKNLKNRVSQYFQPNNPSHTEKVKRMVEQVYDFDYIVVDSEFEALVLECSLIKQNSPKYNILLKDDKGYHYFRITREDYPRITAEKQLVDENIYDYIGPYTSSYSVTQTVNEVNKAFKLPTCSRKFPQDFKKARPCLNFHINQCMGLCRGKISKEEYQKVINQAVEYIKKGSQDLTKQLEQQMEQAAENLDFERAAQIRDRIQAIKKISDTQKVYMINTKNQDAIAFLQNGSLAAVSILKFREYKLVDKEDYTFTDIDDIDTLRQEFVNRYYVNNSVVPQKILLDKMFDDADVLADYLTEQQGRKITVYSPQRGEQHNIIEMALKNAGEKLSKKIERTGKEVVALEELRKLLGLEKPPEYIEAYDISNLGETGKVAGMVTFLNGRPYKKNYKKFKIKNVLGQDDYASMQEVIERRINEYNDETVTDEGFKRKPDLILLDGGQTHVLAINKVFKDKNFNVPLFGMVKDNHHRTRAVATDGGEIAIQGNRMAFSLVTTIQDEVHRYAITYQKNVRKKTATELVLTRVDGIGEKKAQAILKEFKTKQALKNATVEELKRVAKVNENIAKELYDFLQEMF